MSNPQVELQSHQPQLQSHQPQLQSHQPQLQSHQPQLQSQQYIVERLPNNQCKFPPKFPVQCPSNAKPNIPCVSLNGFTAPCPPGLVPIPN